MSSSWSHSQSYPPTIPEGVIPAPRSRDLKMIVESREPSGLQYTWRLWRHCCCRYGWYPLLVAPLVTAGCLLSIYSAYGCDFVRVEIGFIPSNENWNASGYAEFGLLSYQSGEPETDKFREVFLNGCRVYSNRFSEIFIDGDRTWKVARVMSYVSGTSSLLGMVISCLFVLSPLPACFFWPGVLLPSLIAAFLAEGFKFLLFDAATCRSRVWFPEGSDSLPQIAQSCSLGSTSYCCMAAGVAFFFSLLLVCIKAPTKRTLASDYGICTMVVIGPTGTGDESPSSFLRSTNYFGEQDMSNEDSDYSESRASSSFPDDRSQRQLSTGISRSSRESSFDAENPLDGTDSVSGRFSASSREHHNLVSERLKSLDGKDDRYSTISPNTFRIEERNEDCSSSSEERCQPTIPKIATAESCGKDQCASESRLYAAERLRLSASTDSREWIERFVKEVNDSFAAEKNIRTNTNHEADDHNEKHAF